MIAILNKAKGRVGVRGQAVIIILLGLIVAKLYPTLSMVFFAIIGAAIFTYIIKHTALWFYKIDIVQKFVRPVSMLLLALIPIGVAYVIDVFYPSDTERWLIVLYCYIGVALFVDFIGVSKRSMTLFQRIKIEAIRGHSLVIIWIIR